MEIMNRAIEDAADFRGMMGKIQAVAAQEAMKRRLMQATTEGIPITVTVGAPERQPGENRAEHRARLKRERREAKARKVGA